jgi:hypothetical protein
MQKTPGGQRRTGVRLARALTLAALLALPAVAAAGVPGDAASLTLPDIAAWEHGAYLARDAGTGEMLWHTAWRVEHSTVNGHAVIRVEEEGEGRRDSSAPTLWRETMTLELIGSGPRLASTREVKGAEGSPLWTEHRQFEYRDGTGSVMRSDFRTGVTRSDRVELTLRSITPEMLPATLRALPGEAGRQMDFELVIGSDVVGMRAEIVGRERVDVPAGTFDCFKVRLRPTGVKGVLARLVLPEISLWHTVAAPHFWVRYQGPEGGPGARVIVRELTAFERASVAMSRDGGDAKSRGGV